MNAARVMHFLLSAVDKARFASERVRQMVAAAITAFLEFQRLMQRVAA